MKKRLVTEWLGANARVHLRIPRMYLTTRMFDLLFQTTSIMLLRVTCEWQQVFWIVIFHRLKYCAILLLAETGWWSIDNPLEIYNQKGSDEILYNGQCIAHYPKPHIYDMKLGIFDTRQHSNFTFHLHPSCDLWNRTFSWNQVPKCSHVQIREASEKQSSAMLTIFSSNVLLIEKPK